MQPTTWTSIARKAADRLVDQGPVVIVLCLILAGMGVVFWKVVWPFITQRIDKALAEAAASREQRALELAQDAQDKRALHETARLIGVEVNAHGKKLSEHGEKIDDLSGQVRRLPDELVARLTREETRAPEAS